MGCKDAKRLFSEGLRAIWWKRKEEVKCRYKAWSSSIDTVKSARNNAPGANIGAARRSKLTENGD